MTEEVNIEQTKEDPELEAVLAERNSAKKKKRRRWGKKRTMIIAVTAFTVILLLAARVLGSGGQIPVSVTTITLKQGMIQNKLFLRGPVSGTDSAEVVSSLHAEIESIQVKEGDVVKKGQTLAKLNSENVEREVMIAWNDYEIAVAKHEEAEKGAVSGHEKACQDYKSASDHYRRINELYQIGGVSKVEYETARIEMNNAKREMDSYHLEDGKPAAQKSYTLEIKSARLALDQKQKLLEQVEITSPIDGTVVRVNSRVGRFADVVDNDKPLFSIDNLEALKLKIDVSEYSIGKISLGQMAIIRADILGGREEEGEVVSISPTGEEKGGGSTERVIPITIQVLTKDTGLIAGITAKAELVLEEESDAWIVPVSAILQIEDTAYIAAVEDGRICLIPVTTGVESDIEIQVFEDPEEGRPPVFQEGLRVVTNPSRELFDGQPVLEQPVG